MLDRVVDMSTVASLPVAYSFWASIITSVLSEGLAVEGLTPINWRKEEGVLIVAVFYWYFFCCCWWWWCCGFVETLVSGMI